jgi:outer membrane receptor for ferrienterochelin and colicin
MTLPSRWIQMALVLTLLSANPMMQASAQPSSPPTALASAEVTMEDLLNLLTTTPAKKSMTTRETPGIVTIITGEEIASSGARDLIDVLRLVPGFEFGVDNYSSEGPGFRGIWGMEGKILLLVDGQPYNELLYSTVHLGHRNVPMDQIKQVEIIRGPGSAIYGGFAELAVINITTKGPEDLNGAAVALTNGQLERTFSRREGTLSFGKKTGDTGISAAVLIGGGNGSDRTYTDVFGGSYDMARGDSKVQPASVNVGVSHKGLKTRFMVDHIRTTQRDNFSDILPRAARVDFTAYRANAKYDYQVTESLTITPEAGYLRQNPYRQRDEFLIYDKTVERFTGGLGVSYDVNDAVNLMAGAEAYQDRAEAAEDIDPNYLFESSRYRIRYTNRAFYSQGLVRTPVANLALGARYDDHSEVGASFVPRAALTKVINPFHFKLLYSRAFRAPGIENISLNPDIEPEETTVYEVEAGWQLNRTMFLSANVFDVSIEKPIIYYFDAVNLVDAYRNFDRVGTRGVETVYAVKDRWGRAGLTYSYYEPHRNTVDLYRAGSLEHVYLAFPSHKVTLSAAVKAGRKATLGPSAAYLSPRFGYASVDGAGDPVLKRIEPTLLANFFINFTDVFTEGLTLGAGVFDIFGENYKFIQPYNSLHAPLPGPSTEYVIRASYRFLTFHDRDAEIP